MDGVIFTVSFIVVAHDQLQLPLSDVPSHYNSTEECDCKFGTTSIVSRLTMMDLMPCAYRYPTVPLAILVAS
jgi:hypothetical protein